MNRAYRCTLAALMASSSQFIFGASFDCASPNVVRPAEKLICNNTEISKLDESMVNLFNQTKAQLSESSQKIFLNGQRSWLAYWPKYCSVDGRGRVFDSKGSLSCVKEVYINRIQELKLGLLDQKFFYFNVTKYSALTPGKELPDYVKVVEHRLSYPQLEMQRLSADEMNIASKTNEWITRLVQQDKLDFNNPDNEDSLELRISSSSSDILSIVKTLYFNGFGAHPVSTSSQSHFIKSKVKILTAPDIFKSQEWIKPVSNLIFQELKNQQSDMLLIDKSTDLIKFISKPDSWGLTRKGLVFNFNVYEVAAYAAGPQEVTISWKALMPYLTDYAKLEITKLNK